MKTFVTKILALTVFSVLQIKPRISTKISVKLKLLVLTKLAFVFGLLLAFIRVL
jgi:hypothetical protein